MNAIDIKIEIVLIVVDFDVDGVAQELRFEINAGPGIGVDGLTSAKPQPRGRR